MCSLSPDNGQVFSVPKTAGRNATPNVASDDVGWLPGEDVVQPVVGGVPEDRRGHPFAVSLSSVGFCEQAELLGAGEVLVEHLALAGGDQVGLVVGHEGWAGDLFGGPGVAVAEHVLAIGADRCHSVGRHPRLKDRFHRRLVQQRLELLVGCPVVDVISERPELGKQRWPHVELAGVDDQRGEAMLAGGAAGRDQAAKGTADQDNPVRIDLRLGRERVEHLGDDVLPVWAHRHPAVIEGRSLPGSVDRRERVAAIQRRRHRRIQFLGGRVIAADVQDRGVRAIAVWGEQVAREGAGQKARAGCSDSCKAERNAAPLAANARWSLLASRSSR